MAWRRDLWAGFLGRPTLCGYNSNTQFYRGEDVNCGAHCGERATACWTCVWIHTRVAQCNHTSLRTPRAYVDIRVMYSRHIKHTRIARKCVGLVTRDD
jgi:hypothetical protein